MRKIVVSAHSRGRNCGQTKEHGGTFFWQGVAWYLAFTIKGKRMVEDAIII